MFKRLSFFVMFAALLSSAEAQITLNNPILPGFYPDPSICRVGEDYYLVNSTFAYFPGLPVFHSRDLKNWKQLGSVIDRPSQMSFLGQQLSRGLFAPTITCHDGLFYVCCTNVGGGGNFISTAKNPAGPWSDPVYIKEANGIDPSLLFDGDKLYFVFNSDAPDNKPLYEGHRTIRMFELEPATLKVVGDAAILVNGGVDLSKKPVWIEGPHLYKRNGYYYLMAAEGGTSVNHSEVIFRSKEVRGPYIPYEKNPILTQRHLDPKRKNPISSVGHADLFEGPDGNTYAVFLGVRPYDDDYYNTGRETFIAPVKWTDGWPVINPDHIEVQYRYQVPWKEKPHKGSLPLSGNFSQTYRFNQPALPSDFLFLRTRDSSWYTLRKPKGVLSISLRPETVMQYSHPAFMGRRQQHLTSSASVEMDFSASAENEKAGLLAFQNEKHFYYICKSRLADRNVVQLFKPIASSEEMELLRQIELPESASKIYLKITAERDRYSCWYALKPGQWKLLQNNLDARFLSTKTAGGFVGSFFAMYATSSGKTSTATARYHWFHYEGRD